MYLPDFLSVSSPLPTPGPDEGPVCFTFDRKWVPYVLGALKALTVEGVYGSGSGDAIGEANNLLADFMEQGLCAVSNDTIGAGGCDCMGCCIRMRDGILQVLDCGEWIPVDGWDPKAIASTPGAYGDGTPVPDAGKCQTYVGKVNAASKWALPATVNTGDVITVTNANGSWWTPLDLGIQRCPDGLIFFAGGCVDGTDHTEPGDPLNTAPHDCLIAYDGTHYYDCSAAAEGGPATFTIGLGVANGTLVLMMNTPDTIGFGEINFDIEICNNGVVEWTAVLDFAISTQGFSIYAPSAGDPGWGSWSPGVGWNGTIANAATGEAREGVTIHRAVSFQCTRLVLTQNYVLGSSDAPSDTAQLIQNASTTLFSALYSTPPATGTPMVIDTGPISQAITDLKLYMENDRNAGGSGGFTGSVRLLKLEVHGTGTNPF